MDTLILPNGIQHEGKLYKKLQLEEITGKQQNYLINTKYKSQIDHVERMLGDLIIDLRNDEEESLFKLLPKSEAILQHIHIEDIQFILIKLREISFGGQYFFEAVKCTHCGEKQAGDVKIDLGTLEIINATKEPQLEVESPTGKIVRYKPFTLAGLIKAAQNPEHTANAMFTSTLSAVVESIDGVKADEKLMEGLKAKDLSFIGQNNPQYNKIDTEIIHNCSSCNKDFKIDMDLYSPSFFAPSRI